MVKCCAVTLYLCFWMNEIFWRLPLRMRWKTARKIINNQNPPFLQGSIRTTPVKLYTFLFTSASLLVYYVNNVKPTSSSCLFTFRVSTSSRRTGLLYSTSTKSGSQKRPHHYYDAVTLLKILFFRVDWQFLLSIETKAEPPVCVAFKMSFVR